MKGRTRSFFEDVFVLLIILGVLIAGYYLFFNEDKKEQQATVPSVSEVQNKEADIIDTEALVEKEQEEIIEQNNNLENQKETIEDIKEDDSENQQILKVTKNSPAMENKTIPVEEKRETPLQEETTDKTDTQEDEESTSNTKVDPNRIAHLVKNVDLKLLKRFKQDVKQAMKESIVLDGTRDIKEQSFSIRITVLKNGDYEQLTFRGGDQVTFEKNQKNILKVFPLKIDPKIAQDFPRYLRYTFKFTN